MIRYQTNFIGNVSVCDFQAAEYGCDIVVIRFCIWVQSVFESISAAACCQLSACDSICSTFSFDKSITGYGNLLVCKSCAIIFFFIICRSQSDIPSLNCEGSFFLVDDELIRYIIAIRIFYDRITCNNNRICTCIRCGYRCLQAFHCILLSVDCEFFCNKSLCRMFGTIIFHCAAL